MIPAAFVALDQMPLTPDGEPARGTLEHPPVPAPGHGQGERLTPTQAGLSACGPGCCSSEQVGLDDDFFALGGNSLLAAEMLAHTRVMFGISADYVRPLTRCLLRDPTLRGFARPRRTPARAGWPRTATRPRIDFAREAGTRRSRSARTRARGARGRTGGGRARSCSPDRPGSSAPTCCANCSTPPTARV